MKEKKSFRSPRNVRTKKNKILKNFKFIFKKIPFMNLLIRIFFKLIRTIRARRTSFLVNISSCDPSSVAIVHPGFRGVGSATKELIKDVVEVSEINSKREAKRIARKINKYKPKKVLISGYAIGYDLLAQELKAENSKLRIFLFIHAPFIWFDVYPKENKTFENLLALNKKNIIEKVGFCKRDLAEYFKSLGYNSFFVMNRFYPEKHSFRKINKNKLKIGIWGANFWHRNITNQAIAALMIEGAEIHVNDIGDHFFLDKKRVNIHGILPKKDFLKIISKMDINMYVSFTDCFPMTLVESMQYGIPAIASNTSDVYTFDKNIHQKLTLSTIDGPLGIRKKILEVVDDYEKIQKEIKDYLPVLKNKTEESIEEFLI